MKDLMISERERSLVGLLGGLHEAVAVHREHIVFANDQFAALVGSSDGQRLEGRAMPEFVHPDYTDLVREHLRRSLAGEPGLERLEVELHPQAGQTARVRAVGGAHRLSGRAGAAAQPGRNGAARRRRAAALARPGRPRGKRSTRSAKASSPRTSAAASTT